MNNVWRWPVLVAAPAVIALAMAAVVDFVHGTDNPRKVAKTSNSPATPAGTPARARSALPASGPQPRFVVGIRRSGAAVVVRDVRTFASRGGVTAPANQRFSQVASAGARSYIISSSDGDGVAFHRLRLGPDGKPAALTTLPRVRLPGRSTTSSDMAVTRDGRTIAYVMQRKVYVVSVVTGARRTWTTSHTGRIGGLSWTGRTLSFVWAPMHGRTVVRRQIRSLDPRSPAGDLKVSRPVLVLPRGAEAAVASRDGKTIVAGSSGPSGLTLTKYATYPAGTVHQAGVLWRHPAGDPARPVRLTRLVSDGSGGHLIVGASDGRLYVVPAVGAGEFRAGDLAELAW